MCDQPDVIEANIRSVKLSSPDYRSWDPEEALKDYWHRIKMQEADYEEVTDEDGPFIKIMNVGERIVVNRIEGAAPLPSFLFFSVSFFLVVAFSFFV